MARGYPDFFGFSIFPQYGTFSLDEALGQVCASGATTEITEVLGKGVTYGGYLHLSFDAEDKETVGVIIEIDSNIFRQDIYLPMAAYHRWVVENRFLRMIEYSWNGITSYLIFEIADGFTFSFNLKLSIWNTSGVPVSSSHNIWWAQVI